MSPLAAAAHTLPDVPAQTTSLWMHGATLPSLLPVTADLRADVCVVGAGIAGLSVAYQLARAGAGVVVVDERGIGAGETARTSAHLSSVLDTRYAQLESLHGPERTRLVASSHARAVDEIEAIAAREHIACEFRRVDGYLFASPDTDPALLDAEHAAALRAGLDDTTWVERAPLLPFDTRRCLRFPRQAQCHPLRYLGGLADALGRAGVRLVAGRVTRVEGAPIRVELASKHLVRADAVVIATNTPINDRITIHTKQAAYRSYVIAAPLPIGTVPPGLYWDTDDPYHYVRLEPHDDACDLLIVGGEDHHTGESGDGRVPFERLEAWAHARFATLGPVLYRWSGQILAAVDGLAFIGRNPGDEGKVFVVTGDCGNGLTHGTIAGILLAELVAGRSHPWTEVYDPARITPRAAWTFARESLHVAAGYARWLAPARTRRERSSRPVTGRCSSAASARSPSIATSTAACTSGPRSVPPRRRRRVERRREVLGLPVPRLALRYRRLRLERTGDERVGTRMICSAL